MNDVLAPGEARRLGQRERQDTLRARNTRLVEGQTITMRVRRSEAGGLAEFRIPYRKWMRVLDALNWVAENHVPDLAYRWHYARRLARERIRAAMQTRRLR